MDYLLHPLVDSISLFPLLSLHLHFYMLKYSRLFFPKLSFMFSLNPNPHPALLGSPHTAVFYSVLFQAERGLLCSYCEGLQAQFAL